VKGFVDDSLRALLRVPLSASRAGSRTDVMVWIDTAFNGGLAIPRKQVSDLGLVKESSAEAILVDGRSAELETFACLSTGSATATRRRSPPAKASIHCWERCSWTAAASTSITRQKQSNSHRKRTGGGNEWQGLKP
jgi:hypothetical protein